VGEPLKRGVRKLLNHLDSPNFQITIIEQSWLPGASAEEDLCSHGRIRLLIGGQQITSGKEDYGISESALSLLRTLQRDHSAAQPVAQMLIFHGCGTKLVMGCPIGVDWDVHHVADRVRISKVVRYDGTGDGDATTFPNLIVDLSETEYRDQVLAFAQEAKKPFSGIAKTFADDFDRQQYNDFWREYDALLG